MPDLTVLQSQCLADVPLERGLPPLRFQGQSGRRYETRTVKQLFRRGLLRFDHEAGAAVPAREETRP